MRGIRGTGLLTTTSLRTPRPFGHPTVVCLRWAVSIVSELAIAVLEAAIVWEVELDGGWVECDDKMNALLVGLRPGGGQV